MMRNIESDIASLLRTCNYIDHAGQDITSSRMGQCEALSKDIRWTSKSRGLVLVRAHVLKDRVLYTSMR